MSDWIAYACVNPQTVVVSVLLAVSIPAWILLLFRSKRNSKSSLVGAAAGGAKYPPHVRSWIPYLGSAIEMGQGSINEFIRGKSKQLDDAPLFTATILGDKCIFVNDPEYLTIVFKPSFQKYLDVYSLQKQFSAKVLDASPSELVELFSDKVAPISTKQFHHFLFKGDELERSMAKVQEFFLDFIPRIASSTDWTSHRLFDLVGTAVFKASTGPLLSGICPTDETYTNFREFDAGVIPLFNSAPAMFLNKARRARSNLLKLMESSQFAKLASPFLRERAKLPMSEMALFKANMGLLWASSGNSIPAVFWTVLHLLEDPVAWNACQAQVNEVIAKRDTHNDSESSSTSKSALFTLDELDEFTLLESAFMEVLRLYQGNFTARLVVEDFVLETSQGNYWIEKGCKLMSFWGILHTDPDIFQDADKFQYDRFVDMNNKVWTYNSGRTLSHAPVIPFGGGGHLCPGRKFISYEMRLFMALLMQNLEFRLPQTYQHPGIDYAMQGIGVSQPDQDPAVEIRLKKANT